MSDLTIFSVATDRYLNFWEDLIRSSIGKMDKNLEIQWLVCTNKPKEISQDIRDYLGVNLVIREIAGEKWPFPTLLRYKYLKDSIDAISGDLLMHLDADMKIESEISIANLTAMIGDTGLGFVSHPGYYRPYGVARGLFYLQNPIFILRDIKFLLKFGARGAWENNKNSKAYIKRSLRKNYVCGGTWIGKTEKILSMCTELDSNIQIDLANGVIAIYHDESHLNAFISTQRYSISLPEYCYEISFPQLKNIACKIAVVNKNLNSPWNRD